MSGEPGSQVPFPASPSLSDAPGHYPVSTGYSQGTRPQQKLIRLNFFYVIELPGHQHMVGARHTLYCCKIGSKHNMSMSLFLWFPA